MSSVWYFAYGSNMQTATFRGRRGIEFVRAHPARVRGWQVVFDKPPLLPIGESFANLLPQPGAEALGVVYEIGSEDLEHVKLTEGVAIGNYEPVDVEAERIEEGDVVAAVSLSSPRRAPHLRPSTRYMDLVIAGAIEHRLPEDYVALLRGIVAGDPSLLARAMRPLMEEFLKRR